jgi:hypothetical protein
MNVEQTLANMKVEADAFAAVNAAYAKHKKNPSDVELKNDFILAQNAYRAIYDKRMKEYMKGAAKPFRAANILSGDEFAKACEEARNNYYAGSVCTSNAEVLKMYSQVKV